MTATSTAARSWFAPALRPRARVEFRDAAGPPECDRNASGELIARLAAGEHARHVGPRDTPPCAGLTAGGS